MEWKLINKPGILKLINAKTEEEYCKRCYAHLPWDDAKINERGPLQPFVSLKCDGCGLINRLSWDEWLEIQGYKKGRYRWLYE